MGDYKYSDDTLIHSIAFNPYKLESILTNGILSKGQAEKEDVNLTRNYKGFNSDFFISMIKPSNSIVSNRSAYDKYTTKGISFIVENQKYINDRDSYIFNYDDEVYVDSKVPTSNIKGLLVPDNYLDYELDLLPVLNISATSFENIRSISISLLKYLESYGYTCNSEEFELILYNVYACDRALFEAKKENSPEEEFLTEDYMDSKRDLDDFLANEVNNCFRIVLGKDKVTLEDLINFINDKTLKLPIYTFDSGKKRKK